MKNTITRTPISSARGMAPLSMLIVSAFFLFCSSTGKELVFKKVNTHKTSFRGYTESKEKIDAYRTFELFFTLEKPVKCVKAEITAKYISDTFTKKTKPAKTFFIMEKAVDLSGFKDAGAKRIFSEIAKNFDGQWNRQKELIVCGSDSDPFKILDEKSLYRIRYTTFGDEEYEFEIEIHADCAVFFREKTE